MGIKGITWETKERTISGNNAYKMEKLINKIRTICSGELTPRKQIKINKLMNKFNCIVLEEGFAPLKLNEVLTDIR